MTRFAYRHIFSIFVLTLAVGLWSPAVSSGAGVGLSYVSCVAIDRPDCVHPGVSDLGFEDPLYLSPDGRSAYAFGSVMGYGLLVEYARNKDGRLAPLGCKSTAEFPEPGCVLMPRGSDFSGVVAAISPDGRHVYQGDNESSVNTFLRGSKGKLRYQSCVSLSDAFDCAAKIRGFGTFVPSLSVSPDSRNVYAGYDDGIIIFRQFRRGGLRYQGCVSAVTKTCVRMPKTSILPRGVQISPNGKLAMGITPSGVTMFLRGKKGFLRHISCLQGKLSYGGQKKCSLMPGSEEYVIGSSDIGPNWHRLYLGLHGSDGSGAIVTYKVSKHGRLKYMNCLADEEFDGIDGCEPTLDNPTRLSFDITITPEGRSLYVSLGGDKVARYDVGGMGKLRYRGCISINPEQEDCQQMVKGPRALRGPKISPDGRSYYFGFDGEWWIYKSDGR